MDNEKRVLELNLDDILPNRFQPRIKFNEDAINELAESIKEHGVIQPIIVRQIGDKYEIIAGERRYKASVLAGKVTIPAIVTNLSDRDSAEIALIENVQREDLSPIEEAISYRKILDMGLTQEQLADKLDRNQSTIANKLRLLNLEEDVQEALLNNEISERHARSLLRLQDKKTQVDMLNRVINERLTVRKTDEEIDKLLNNNENIPTNEDGGIWLSNNDRKGEIMDNNDNMNFNIPSEPIIDDMEEKPIDLAPIDNQPVPETLEINDLENSINFENNEEDAEHLFNNLSNQYITNENPIIEEKPGFLDIDKIETEAKDIYTDKPHPDINNLLQTNNPEQTNKPVIEEPNLENNEDNFWSNKFFNIENENQGNDTSTEENNRIFDDETFIIDSNNSTSPAIEENNNNTTEDNLIIENNETKTETNDLFNPSFGMNEETNKTEFDNIINDDTIEEPNLEDDVYSPINVEENEEQSIGDLKTVINTIRDCARTIEKMGYVIDTEELDFENEYRVTFKIEK